MKWVHITSITICGPVNLPVKKSEWKSPVMKILSTLTSPSEIYGQINIPVQFRTFDHKWVSILWTQKLSWTLHILICKFEKNVLYIFRSQWWVTVDQVHKINSNSLSKLNNAEVVNLFRFVCSVFRFISHEPRKKTLTPYTPSMIPTKTLSKISWGKL